MKEETIKMESIEDEEWKKHAYSSRLSEDVWLERDPLQVTLFSFAGYLWTV